ncbi:MAG: type II toxin-antitoxin system PemK/MazF family toxin [Clostridiales Family XIII bacterium]|jgi:mRNA interferase MazF|nr:type II toxin-antitoxin system PemK/MazF family toxin [Clostridiales Family XIII bacterium]
MVSQGDIVKIDFSPTMGHEQSGYRPAVVVSNDSFHKYSKLVLVCPVTNTSKNFPMYGAMCGTGRR